MKRIRSHLIKNIILPIADHVMGTNINFHLTQIQKMKNWTSEEIQKWQTSKLKKLVQHAYDNCLYYKNLFTEIGISPYEINEINDLEKIPILTKEIIRKNYQDLIPKNINKIRHHVTSTGGSSGNPLIYLLDNESWSYCNADTILQWEKGKYKYGDKFVALGSTSLFVTKKSSLKHYIYYFVKNKVGLNGINMSNSTCESYLNYIKKKKIKYIYGYASSIYLLAKHSIDNGIKVKIEECFSTSEVLLDHYRETIIKAFNCKIINCYGAHDGGISAFEHERDLFEVGFNSIIRPPKSNIEEYYPAIITDLLNFATPLINYKLGDEFILVQKNEKYPYNGQIIKKVLGRTSDLIKLENGSMLTGPGFTVLFSSIPVDYYFIEKVGFNSIVCSIRVVDGFNKEHESLILGTLKKQCGSDVSIEIKRTDHVQFHNNGKIKYFG